jgi:TATA-binding protein-associated factor Taf7
MSPNDTDTPDSADEALVAALASGLSYVEAAEKCGISKATVCRRMRDREFRRRVAEARGDMVHELVNRLTSKMLAAADVAVELLKSKDERVRLAAAEKLIKGAFNGFALLDVDQRLDEIEDMLAEPAPDPYALEHSPPESEGSDDASNDDN